jgi:hypothetical protein
MDRQWLYFGLLCGRGTGDAGWPGIAHTAGIDPSPYGGHKKNLLKLVTRTHSFYEFAHLIDMKKFHISISIIEL